MPFPDLESRTSALFAKCDAMLGDTITVAPPSGPSLSIKVHAAHRDTGVDFGLTSGNAQDALVDLDRALVPGKPDATWRITLPRVAGKVFQPRDVKRDDSGFRWVFGLKEVVNG